MNYAATIQKVYEHLENDRVDQAVMACLRLARHLHDYLYVAIFMHHLYPDRKQLNRLFFDETVDLKKEVRNAIWDLSFEYAIATRTLDIPIAPPDEEGDEPKMLSLGVGEFDQDIERTERSIADKTVPAGMHPYDTAAFTAENESTKSWLRLRISAVHRIKQRIGTLCLNYAIGPERQLDAQTKPQSFLHRVQTDVNNYFQSHCEDVYVKLQNASKLVDSTDPEDSSNLLGAVRRAIKAAADYFYPPRTEPVMCSDGKTRALADNEPLNRLQEYLTKQVEPSTSRDLLEAQMQLVRRLNDAACKGIHANVTPDEAKQGLIALYMFLFAITSRLQVHAIS